jgi:hypothetical protein
MITKQQFTDSCLKEIKIYKHLYGKILPGTMDFRPSEKQRSLKELLQFIMHSFAMELKGIQAGNIGDFQAAIKESAQTNTENFPAKMDQLARQIKSIMETLSDGQLDEQIDLFGRGSTQTRATWLFELILKNLVGYKMQLFLYIKQTGNNDIGTPDLWRGEDSKHRNI